MSGVPAQIVVFLNAIANTLGRPLLAPLGSLPGWVSASAVASVTGVFFLLVFKYTSNQAAIKRVRNDINANLFALKLFKDATPVVLRAQAAMLRGAGQLFVLAIVPMLVMIVPALLILGQLALWYQHRPLRVGEETVLAMKLNDLDGDPMPSVALEPTSAAEVVTGPVRIPSKREVVWVIKAAENGSTPLNFIVSGQKVTKELAVGEGFMRISPRRPEWNWYDALTNPAEPTFPTSSLVQSIEIDYPDRPSWTSGTDYWVGYWFVVSMVAAFCAKPFLKVNL